MNCRQARKLIRAGVIPGASYGRNIYLGFHLAECTVCRTFRLQQTQPKRTSSSLGRTLAATNVPSASRSWLRANWVGMLGTLIAVLCLLAGWYVGIPLARAWNDLKLISSLPTGDATSVHTRASALRATPTSTARSPDAYALRRPAPSETRLDTLHVRRAIATQTAQPSATPSSIPTTTATSLPASTPTPTATATRATEPTPAPGPALTILLLGIDARAGEGTHGRSDSIIILHLDPQHDHASMLSLPRDLWVPISGAREGKINSSYFVGEQQGQGAMLAKQTVGRLLNIPIDYAVVVDFAGFRSLIDALGGVPVDVPRELYDNRFPTEDYGYTVAHFVPGVEVMNGERALMFSRVRHPDSDFQRMRRQQLVLLGIARKLRERGFLENMHNADRITGAVRPFVRTDIPAPLALNLLWSMRSVDPNTVTRLVADTSVLSEANIGGAYALLARPNVLHSLGAQLLAPPH